MRRLLLLCGLVIALGLGAIGLWLSRTGTAEGTNDSGQGGSSLPVTFSAPENNSSQQPTENPPTDRLRLPEATNHTVADLIDGLMAAADDLDNVALMEIRALLLARDQVDVSRAARAQIVVEREQPSTRLPQQRVCRLGHLFLLTKGEGDPPALTELRRRWSEPEISQGRLAKWTLINRRPIGERASRALADEDVIEARAVGYAILLELSWGQGKEPGVTATLRSAYKSGIPDGEVPDPWVSEVVDRLARHRSEIQAVGWDTLVPCLRTLHDLKGISGRLREQIAALFVEKPGSFWELMEALNDASSIEPAARALIGLMYSRALSTDEVDMFLALFRQKFGWGASLYEQLMKLVMGEGPNIPRVHVQDLAASLLQVAHDSDDAYHWNTAIAALYGMRYATMATVAGDDLLARKDKDFKQLLKALNRKALRTDNAIPKQVDGFSAAMVLDLVWTMDLPADERIALALELVRSREKLGYVDIIWTINGLERQKDELFPSLGSLVASLIEEVFFRADMNAVRKAGKSPETGPLPLLSSEVFWVDQSNGVLSACGFPTLGEVSRDLLVSWARRTLEYYEQAGAAAAEGEDADIGRPIRDSAMSIVATYGR